ncbi:putative E3 ubiquitin-protein ligase TRIM39-like [Scophthalmus maximus]|uniref:Putative E3 ubiquitin-protein ligase TRIM39-like n=1 Tax=Scophthalmus maximus TaxID=52904 RepID=A0A2U9CHW6_SCOMX|nr:putative E3 ubiquitin-protein ligase TRIM39-like [Scophthalmus maximus]
MRGGGGGGGMDLLWRILAALSLDCFKDSSSSRSPTKLSSSQAGSLESSSLTGSLSLGPDVPHCQCCIAYEARLKRLSCGHLYCDTCCDQIVNLAFEDIEGLSDYPCPMCKSIRQLGGLGPSSSACLCGPYGLLQQPCTGKEHGSQWG